MLHAILGNKAGRITVGEESVSVRELYKDREDMLTATVISRLRYLTPEICHKLLSHCLPESSYDFRSLKSVDFWPRFYSEYQHQVEPDVILYFDWGIMVIEVKRPHDGWQYDEQWYRQISAIPEEYTQGGVLFLALGGDCRENLKIIQRVKNRLQSEQVTIEVDEMHQLGWLKLAQCLSQIINEADITRSDMAALDDILKALDLYGVAVHPVLETLPCIPIRSDSALYTLNEWQSADPWHGLDSIKTITLSGINTWTPIN